jgi:hypothetical protein
MEERDRPMAFIRDPADKMRVGDPIFDCQGSVPAYYAAKQSFLNYTGYDNCAG